MRTRDHPIEAVFVLTLSASTRPALIFFCISFARFFLWLKCKDRV